MTVTLTLKHHGLAGMLAGLAALITVSVAGEHAVAAPPELEIPVACEIGKECFIQFYVDRDGGTGAADYRCGALSYDGHKGTDFRLVDLPAMNRGVVVRAAASGRVRAIRDGESDISADESSRRLDGREAGNAVVLVHGGGWETQYNHLMKGSITVAKGQQVRSGEALGLIGLSGNTTFPHLDFTVRRGGKIVDPFGDGAAPACAATGGDLWSAAAAKHLAYQPGAVLLAGFAAQIPDRHNIRRGAHRAAELSTLAPILIFWVDMFGSVAGDTERFRILAPDGTVVAERQQRLDKSAHQHFESIGRLRPDPGAWPAGTYRGEYLLFREIDGERRPFIGAVRQIILK